MRVLVIGATGGSGRAVYETLLIRGHDVTAFARRASSLPQRPRLERIDGDATDVALLDRVLPGHDAVIVTLGISESPMRVRLRGPQHTPGDIRSRGTAAVVAAARRARVQRIVVQSSYGVGPSRARLGLSDRVLFALLLKPQMADTETQETVVRDSGLDWTIVQPVHLTDGESAAHFASAHGDVRDWRVSRRGVAHVHADLVEQSTHIGETVAVSG